jgi:hypothetical protein
MDEESLTYINVTTAVRSLITLALNFGYVKRRVAARWHLSPR